MLGGDGHAGTIYELAGHSGLTLTEFAAEISRQTGKPIKYQNMTARDYAAALASHGVRQPFAKVLAEADTAAEKGELFEAVMS
jgi:NAD(P)H dehydrogenase (quinone)